MKSGTMQTGRKLLFTALAVIMLVCLMSVTALAVDGATVGGVEYSTLEEAVTHIDDDTSMTEVSEALWPSSTPIYVIIEKTDGTTETQFYSKLDEGPKIEAYTTFSGYGENVKSLKIYCRPGSENITCSSDHPSFTVDTTIYGNGTVLERGAEMSVESYISLTKNVELKIVNLGNSGFWGGRTTAFTVDLYLINCQDAHEICFRSPTTGTGIINTAVKGCTFAGNSKSASCSIQSKFGGTVMIEDCTFSNVAVPVNFNNDAATGQNITVKNCTFTDCAISSTTGYDATYCAPIRVVAPNATPSSTLTVDGCTFNYTGANVVSQNGDIVVGEQRANKEGAGVVSYEIKNTTGELKVYMIHDKDVTPAVESKELTTSTTETGKNATVVAVIGDKEYFSLAAAVTAAEDGDTITLVADDNISLTNGGELEIQKSLIITGDLDSEGAPKYTIYGTNTSNGYNDVFINVNSSDAEVTISGLKFAQFGNQKSTASGHAPIWVSMNNKAKVNIKNVTVSEFNRTGIFLGGGEFSVENCTIDCEKSTDYGKVLTKGIEVHGTANGTIISTAITGMNTTYEDWTTGGIEIYGEGTITIEDCAITGLTNGIATSDIGHTEETPTDSGAATVNVKDCYIEVDENAIETGSDGSKVSILSGTYSGEICERSSKTGKIIISGGTFDVEPDATYIAAGCIALKDGNFWVVGEPVATYTDENSEVHQAPTLQSAIDNVADGGTVTLLRNITLG